MTNALIRRTAKDLAGAFFDNMDVFQDARVERTTIFRQECPDQHAFVQLYWPDFVAVARKVLTHMLTEPGTTQIQKDAIFDALLKDRGFLTDADKAAPSIIQLN